jgi:hypothetical protein
MLLCYITTGATVFCVYQEKWSFVDAFFFAFSVLWTIGLQAENTDQQQTDGLFVIICTLYLLIGTVYILGQQALSACFMLYITDLNYFMGHLDRVTCTVYSISTPDQPGRIQM